MNYVDRVAERAVQVRVVVLLLSLLALPFYAVGFVVAVVWLALKWCYAAVLVGFSDAAVKFDRGGDDAAG